jgi:hypothetical protein
MMRPTKKYRLRFALIYAGLGVVLLGALAGVLFIVAKPTSSGGSSSWSNWKPSSGTTSAVTKQIAQHVQAEYHLNKAGSQLVTVISGPPTVTSGTHKVSISNIVVRKTPNSNKDLQLFPATRTWSDQFCGVGSLHCSIAQGQATLTRGRLVRREALEVALYTFKYVPKIDSVVAYMPPAPGATTAPLLLLQKSALSKQLAEPLAKTLPLKNPPLPNNADLKEKATIDKLTLPDVYSYSLQALQDNSALLVLDPTP